MATNWRPVERRQGRYLASYPWAGVAQMSKKRSVPQSREERIARELEADLANQDAWERMPDIPQQSRSLSTQVSVRLDADDAKRLRHVARAQKLGYTSLLRRRIEERLHHDEKLLSSFS